ncbi:MAG: type II secretion system protein [Fimbriimonadaceae bacterium]
MRRFAFTLVELLTVIAILAILLAVTAPVFRSVKGAVQLSSASRALGQMQLATTMYQMDYNGQFPPAIQVLPDGRWHTWFGEQTYEGDFDRENGVLRPYLKALMAGDPTLVAEPYLGDGTGFGYNYGYLGSDLYLTGDWSRFPQSHNPARIDQLSDPSSTLVFATTAFYNVNWLPNGDGGKYEFNFFDPPEVWNGVPNVDFRHISAPEIDEEARLVRHDGKAIFAFADGRTASLNMDQVTPEMFRRTAY